MRQWPTKVIYERNVNTRNGHMSLVGLSHVVVKKKTD